MTAELATSLNTLLVGDDGTLAAQLDSLDITASINVESIGDYLTAIASLGTEPRQVIFCYLDAVEEKVGQVFSALRNAAPGARIIICCQPFQEHWGQMALQNGADDYLIVPPTTQQLCAALGLSSTTPSIALPVDSPASGQRDLNTSAEFSASVLRVLHELTVKVDEGLAQLAAEACRAATSLLTTTAAAIECTDGSPERSIVRVYPASQDARKILTGNGPRADLRQGERKVGILALAANDDQTDPSRQTRLDEFCVYLSGLFNLATRNEQLQRLAVTDELSSAYNRRYVMHYLKHLLLKARQQRFRVTVLLFDIDNFKHYNDMFGHAAGDQIIRDMVMLMRRTTRPHDLVGRLGGDEFVIVFWDAEQPRKANSQHPSGAAALAERFRCAVCDHQFAHLGPEMEGSLSISGGLATFPWDGDSVNELLARADEALLTAKGSGKNRIYLIGPESGMSELKSQE